MNKVKRKRYDSEKKMEAAEMRMLMWMSGVTRNKDRISNEVIRGAVKVRSVSRRG